MTQRPLDILFLGLSLSSSWGNGHATTFRALMRGLNTLGHRLTFLERDVPWYSEHRDLPESDFCELVYYDSVADLTSTQTDKIRGADVVIVGSYVPEGVAVIDAVAALTTGIFCFYDIDTPVTLSKLLAGNDEYITPRQIPLFDTYLSFTGGPILEHLRTQFHARRAEPLYCSVDETRYAPTGESFQLDLGYLGTYSPDRQPALKRLLIDVAEQMPECRFAVAGPRYPTTIDWPKNVERIDHLPPSEHASFYSRQRFTLNVTRSDMVAAGWSPSVRLFEAAACGCPAISDWWPGLDDFFAPGKAIHVVQETRDVCAILADTDQSHRTVIAKRARKSVLDAHTGTARALDLLNCLTNFGETDPSRIQAA